MTPNRSSFDQAYIRWRGGSHQKRKGYVEPANRVYKIVPELF